MRRHGGVDRVHELPELDRAMPLMKLRDRADAGGNAAGRNVTGRPIQVDP
jgi:hypothetical protein